jgi:hypothetical protein
LFDLRRSPDFSLLQKQGFIETQAHTRQDITRQDKTRQDTGDKSPKPVVKKTASKRIDKPDFESIPNLTSRWFEWAKFRQSIGARVYKTTRAAEELAKHPVPVQDAAIEQAMTKEWKSLYPDQIKSSSDGLSPGLRKSLQNMEELRGQLR